MRRHIHIQISYGKRERQTREEEREREGVLAKTILKKWERWERRRKKREPTRTHNKKSYEGERSQRARWIIYIPSNYRAFHFTMRMMTYQQRFRRIAGGRERSSFGQKGAGRLRVIWMLKKSSLSRTNTLSTYHQSIARKQSRSPQHWWRSTVPTPMQVIPCMTWTCHFQRQAKGGGKRINMYNSLRVRGHQFFLGDDSEAENPCCFFRERR